jgi:hypothetical protein
VSILSIGLAASRSWRAAQLQKEATSARLRLRLAAVSSAIWPSWCAANCRRSSVGAQEVTGGAGVGQPAGKSSRYRASGCSRLGYPAMTGSMPPSRKLPDNQDMNGSRRVTSVPARAVPPQPILPDSEGYLATLCRGRSSSLQRRLVTCDDPRAGLIRCGQHRRWFLRLVGLLRLCATREAGGHGAKVSGSRHLASPAGTSSALAYSWPGPCSAS